MISNDKHNVVALMLSLSKVDNEVDELEYRFIVDMASKMGLSTEDVHRINSNIDDYELVPPKDEMERMNILYQLLFLMKIDGAIRDEEVKMVQRVGFKLGFRQTLTQDLIEVIRNHIREQVPVAQMLDNIRKYLN